MSRKKPETRARICAAAWRLLAERRGLNVRMEDIAEAAEVSRQAVYLHFKSRVRLMVATVQYGDELNAAAAQARPWKEATGVGKLDAWIAFWGNYVPQIFGVAKALMIARETDEAAAAAWDDRMQEVRRSCRTTIQELADRGLLATDWDVEEAADLLWTMLSVSGWEQLTVTCNWSTHRYISHLQIAARRTFLK